MLTLLLCVVMTAAPSDFGDVEMPAGRYMPASKIQDLALVSSRARLVYLSLHPFVDREGRVAGHPGLVKSMIGPIDPELTPRKIGQAIEELERAGQIVGYVDAEGRTVIKFRGFEESQPAAMYLAREAASRYGPPLELPPRQLLPDSRPTANDPVGSSPDVSPQTPLLKPPPASAGEELELKGFEVGDSKTSVVKREANLPTIASAVRQIRRHRGAEMLDALKVMLDNGQGYQTPRREDEEAAFALVWFAYYTNKIGSPDDMLDDQRDGLIRRRFVECNRDGDLMLFVIDGTRRDDFRMGRDARKGNDPRLRSVRSILKNFETMQELARKGGWQTGKIHPVRARLDSLGKA